MAIERLMDLTGARHAPDALYTELCFPTPPPDRPYVFMNMVATVDGKTLLGPRGSTAKGLGSPTDQLLMRRLEAAADGAFVGASTLRAGNVIYLPRLWRATLTQTGDLPLENRFFTDSPERAVVFAPECLTEEPRKRIVQTAALEIAGPESVDITTAVKAMRAEFGVRYLVLEGGASLNDSFLRAGLVDEVFLTVAPKLKGGADAPTVVDGRGFPADQYCALSLQSLYRDGDELYLRYRVNREAET